jgi:hypothetical protein
VDDKKIFDDRRIIGLDGINSIQKENGKDQGAGMGGAGNSESGRRNSDNEKERTLSVSSLRSPCLKVATAIMCQKSSH